MPRVKRFYRSIRNAHNPPSLNAIAILTQKRKAPSIEGAFLFLNKQVGLARAQHNSFQSFAFAHGVIVNTRHTGSY